MQGSMMQGSMDGRIGPNFEKKMQESTDGRIDPNFKKGNAGILGPSIWSKF